MHALGMMPSALFCRAAGHDGTSILKAQCLLPRAAADAERDWPSVTRGIRDPAQHMQSSRGYFALLNIQRASPLHLKCTPPRLGAAVHLNCPSFAWRGSSLPAAALLGALPAALPLLRQGGW